jgi:hypothetical protein
MCVEYLFTRFLNISLVRIELVVDMNVITAVKSDASIPCPRNQAAANFTAAVSFN